MGEIRLEYRCKPKNLCDKGGIEMCITKAKVDMISKVWGKSSGTSLVLSLKGETSPPSQMIADRKREQVLIEKKEAKAPQPQNGEFYLKKKVRKKVHLNCFVRGHVLSHNLLTPFCRDREYGGCSSRDRICGC